jgi:hypothetical protein
VQDDARNALEAVTEPEGEVEEPTPELDQETPTVRKTLSMDMPQLPADSADSDSDSQPVKCEWHTGTLHTRQSFLLS